MVIAAPARPVIPSPSVRKSMAATAMVLSKMSTARNEESSA
jgi:hypothetical protein